MADPETLLAQLRDVREQMDRAELERSQLYEARLDLFQQARAADPPISHRAIAEAAGVSEPAVIQALRKANAAAPAAAT
jgi:hypothetical protein